MTGLTDTQLHAARAALAGMDAALARAHAATPPIVWRHKSAGFAGLARLIVEQQVSTASAAAIWQRLAVAIQPFTPQAVLARDIAVLRALGLSVNKARYLHELARAQTEPRLCCAALTTLDDDEAIARLTAIKGIGPWTAQVYLLTCEGRIDLFPIGDVALQEGLRLADGAPDRLGWPALAERAAIWRPHRGAAAHLLWAYYSGVRRGEIAAPSGDRV